MRALAGKTIGGYRLIRLIGSAAFGSLYEARGNGRDVIAVALEPRVRIAKPAEKGSIHPNVVEVVGEAREGEDRLVIVARARGKPVSKAVAFQGKLGPGTAVSVALQVLSGLHAIHQRDRVNGTLCAATVFVDRNEDGSIFATFLDVGEPEIQGMPDDPYAMAPERLANPPSADRRSDIWAVGVLLYEMLFGRRPFSGRDAATIARLVQEKDPVIPADLGGLPVDLVAIVNTALSKDPQKRFANATTMMGDLLPLQEELEERMDPVAAAALRDSLPPASPTGPPATRPVVPAPPKLPVESAGARAERKIVPPSLPVPPPLPAEGEISVDVSAPAEEDRVTIPPDPCARTTIPAPVSPDLLEEASRPTPIVPESPALAGIDLAAAAGLEPLPELRSESRALVGIREEPMAGNRRIAVAIASIVALLLAAAALVFLRGGIEKNSGAIEPAGREAVPAAKKTAIDEDGRTLGKAPAAAAPAAPAVPAAPTTTDLPVSPVPPPVPPPGRPADETAAAPTAGPTEGAKEAAGQEVETAPAPASAPPPDEAKKERKRKKKSGWADNPFG